MFKFSIRDVLWLTLVVAVAAGWFVHYRAMERRYSRRSEYISQLKDALGMSIGRAEAYRGLLRKEYGMISISFKSAQLPPELANEP